MIEPVRDADEPVLANASWLARSLAACRLGPLLALEVA